MNWLMVVVGSLQIGASVQGWMQSQSWRINVMNVLVGLANIVLAGQR